ncbi:hypothetical protein B488_01520 [Liberibacter crescens BT-1]|uniref:DUF599 family protein n=1 Tax=Liberibacter crescens (strain BT-1) TaxID=1215343 RepID=L0ETJ2_LIBCB|nr:DUF599 family protein [Liberibacter crescens]AGA64145.1 hypothetical protein B488_01520 [Liberibacter crescens BT-1]AMC12414.1 membrane protein [Liberibacter crescens]
MQNIDYISLGLFILLWVSLSQITKKVKIFGRISLSRAMNKKRKEWVFNSLHRDLKMIDTQIFSGLQVGTSFLASTSIFALGSSFALLGAAEKADAVLHDLPFVRNGELTAFEWKVIGLSYIFGYAFFKFLWSYRLFNYCTILFGSIPIVKEVEANRQVAEKIATRVAYMNIIAADNYNDGLRTLFLSVGYLGWFISSYIFMITSTFLTGILFFREFYSKARLVILDSINLEE